MPQKSFITRLFIAQRWNQEGPELHSKWNQINENSTEFKPRNQTLGQFTGHNPWNLNTDWHPTEPYHDAIMIRAMKSRSATSFVAINLAEDVESSDEADEAETHNEDDGRRDLESRSVVGVESQHIASAAAATVSAGWSSATGSNTSATHPCSGGRRPPRSHADRAGPGGGGRRRLRLRRASRHRCGV